LIKSIYHSVLYLVLFLIGQDLVAQCSFQILDDASQPLTGVHVKMDDASAKLIKVSDQEGKVFFKADESFNYPIALKLIYLGMEELSLRLNRGAEISVRMFPSAATLSMLVVTGEYAPTSPQHAVSRVDVISAEEISKIGAADIADILQHKADIRIQQDGLIGTGISIQGLSDRDVKVLINEVPVVGRVDGKLDLSQLDVTDIERIEIVKGPMAASYGSDAIAGVINIITKKAPAQSIQGSLRGYYSSEGQYDSQLRIGGSKGHYSYSLRAGRRFFDGWTSGDPTFKDPQPIADARRSRQWNPKEVYQGGLSQSWNQGGFQITHRLDLMTDQLKDRGTPIYTLSGPIALDQEFRTRRMDNSLDFKHLREDGSRFNGYIAYNDFLRIRDEFVTDLRDLNRIPNDGDGVDSTRYRAVTARYTESFELGEDWAYQIGLDGSYEMSSGDRIAGKPEMKAAAFFASTEWSPTAGLTVKPSFRWGWNSLFKLQPAPSIAIRYRRDLFSYRLSYGRGFRAPDFKELFLAFFDSNHNVFGNEELSPEQSNNYAASMNYSVSRSQQKIDLEFALFLNDLKDRIELVQVGGDQTGPAPFTYLNVDEVRTQGFRVDGKLQRSIFGYHLGYGYTGFTQSDQGKVIIPMDYFGQMNASISFTEPKSKLNAEVYLSSTGKRKILTITDEETQSSEQQAYSMLDLSLGRRFASNRLDLRLGVRNLLDVQTLNAAGIGTHQGNSSSTLLATGRNYFITATFNISKKKDERSN